MALVCPSWVTRYESQNHSHLTSWLRRAQEAKGNRWCPHRRFCRHTAPSWDPRQSSQPPQWQTVPCSLGPGMYETTLLLLPTPLPSLRSFNRQEVIHPSLLFVGGHPLLLSRLLRGQKLVVNVALYFFTHILWVCVISVKIIYGGRDGDGIWSLLSLWD